MPIALLLAGTLFGAGIASAETQATDGSTTYQLTPEQKAELLAANSESGKDVAATGGNSCSQNRQVHGEIGAMIGTGGTRGAFGTAAIPLGCEGGAVISFESQQSGYRRIR